MKARQVDGLKRSAKRAGGRSICRKPRERERGTLPKIASVSATLDMEADVGPSVGRRRRNNQDAKNYASVGPLIERQRSKSLE